MAGTKIVIESETLKRETFTIAHFFRKFNYSGLNNFPEIKGPKKDQKLTEKQHKSIIKKFLTIYFYEVYFFKRPVYFLFGGRIMKTRCGNWIRKVKSSEKLTITNHSVGLFWFFRPCARFWFSMNIKKVSGSTNAIPKIEKEWKNENDITSLPLSSMTKKEFTHNQKLFIR